MKDIFIDTQIANRYFPSPPNAAYRDLITWLKTNDKVNPENNAYLVVSPKLMAEYKRSCIHGAYQSGSSIVAIVTQLTIENRLNPKSNKEIALFRKKHFNKRITGCFRCNYEDQCHMVIIFLSNRKLALIDDNNFIEALINFPKFGNQVKYARTPDELPYL